MMTLLSTGFILVSPLSIVPTLVTWVGSHWLGDIYLAWRYICWLVNCNIVRSTGKKEPLANMDWSPQNDRNNLENVVKTLSNKSHTQRKGGYNPLYQMVEYFYDPEVGNFLITLR